MEAIILSDNKVCNFGKLRLWAERGQIHIEDQDTGAYECVSVRTTLRRMSALSDMLGNSKATMDKSGAMEAAEYERIQRMLEQMLEICRRAQEQGMPHDPEARRDLARRRPKTMCMASGNGVL